MMRHLKASESIHDNLARDAAIAEMGRRLAAQAIRARRRQSGHFPAGPALGEDRAGHTGPAPRPVTREDSRPPPAPAPATLVARPRRVIPWARIIAATRRVMLLGATAACGFSLVLYGEHLRVAAYRHHGAPAAEAAREAPQLPPPQLAAVPVIEEILAASTLAAPPAGLRVAGLSAPPAQSVAAGIPQAEAPARPAPANPVPVRTPFRVAAAARPAPPRLVYAALHARRAAPPAPRLPPHVTLARFELPRWLTERPAPPAMPRILSDQPHNLTAPKTAPAATPTAHPEPAAPPQRPRVTYAMASPYNYPYAHPFYAVPHAYPLPPLRRPAFYAAQAPSPPDDSQEGQDQP